jgi:hypothetical protein
MSGRPINESRQLAIIMGDKTYVGAVHYKCGTAERYLSGGGCVACARIIASEQRAARKYLKAHQIAVDSKPEMALEQIEADEIADAAISDYDDAEARRQAAIDDLM